jgi:integrase
MPSIAKRDDYWRVRWRELSGKERSRKCPDKRTADALVRQIEQAHALGREWAPDSAPAAASGVDAAPRVADAIQEWLTERASWQSPRSIVRMRAELDMFVRWAEGEGKCPTVADLSRNVLIAYHAWLQTSHEEAPRQQPRKDGTVRTWTRKVTCSVRSANSKISDLHSWWTWLDREERPGVPRPRPMTLPEAHPEKQNPAPTWAEMDAVIAASTVEWHRRAAWICRCTGLRIFQVARLKWTDLDTERKTLRIRGALGKSRSEKRGRVVPVAPVLLAEVATWKREGDSITGMPWPIDRTTQHTAIARSGVDRAPWFRSPWHAFRSGFETGLIALRGDLAEAVDYLVGHSRGTRDTYAPGLQIGAVQAVALVPPFAPPVRLAEATG